MSGFKKSFFVLALIFGLFPALGNAQVALVSPEDGADVTSPPIFAWESELNFFFFVSLFTYGEDEIYHPFFFAIPFRDSLEMPERWWSKLSTDVPQEWFVVGFEGPRQPVFSETFSFTKAPE